MKKLKAPSKKPPIPKRQPQRAKITNSETYFLSALSKLCPICFESLEKPQNFLSGHFSANSFPLLILRCHGCGLKVHNYCYGIAWSSLGAPFICDMCQFKETTPPKCLICGNDDTLNKAFKRLDKNQWVHVICGLTSNYVLIVDFQTLSMKLMTEETKKVKFSNEVCYICKLSSPGRDLVQCDHCATKAHFNCLLIELKLTETEVVECFLWFKFASYSIPFQKLLNASEELFYEECDTLTQEFMEIVDRYQEEEHPKERELKFRTQRVNGKSQQGKDLVDILKEIQRTLCREDSTVLNRGFRCLRHDMNVCLCQAQTKENDRDIFCEYCAQWYHMECHKITEEPDVYICEKCQNSQKVIPELLALLEKKYPINILEMQSLIAELDQKNLRFLDVLILGTTYALFLDRFEEQVIGGECKVLGDFAMKIPLNVECRLMKATQKYMKNCYWDYYLLEKELNCSQMVKSCLRHVEENHEAIEYNPNATNDLENFIAELKNLEEEVRGHKKIAHNKKVLEFENVWKAQKMIKSIISGIIVPEDRINFLVEESKRHPEITDLKLAYDYYFEKRKLTEALENGVLTRVLMDQEEAMKIMNEDWDMGFLKIGKFSESEIEDVLQKLRDYRKFIKRKDSLKILDDFGRKLQNELQKLAVFKLPFEKVCEERKSENSVGLKLGWNQESILFFEKLLKWKQWNKGHQIFSKVRSEFHIGDHIWRNEAFESYKNNPLLYLSKKIDLKSDFQIAEIKVSIFDLLSLQKIQEYVDEGSEMKKNCQFPPLLENKLNELQQLYSEALKYQEILQKIYEKNFSEYSLESILANLKELNVFLPIFSKIQSFSQKIPEILMLANPKESICETISELEKFMVKKISLLDFSEFLAAKKLAKRYFRLINIRNIEKQNLDNWTNFCNEILENFNLLSKINSIIFGENDRNWKKNEFSVNLLKERIIECLLIERQKNLEPNSIVEENTQIQNKIDISLKLQNYNEIDKNPNLTIILQGFSEILLETRLFFWNNKMSKASNDGILSIDDFLECRLYLKTYIEKLGVPSLQQKPEYCNFKALEKKFEEWLDEYESINRIFLGDQELVRNRVEEFHKSVVNLKENVPVRIKFCEERINNLFIIFEAALKAKKTLWLMNYEKKELAFSCIETLNGFFKEQIEQNPAIGELIPFSKDIISKYSDLQAMKTRLLKVQEVLREKNKKFKSCIVKAPDVKEIQWKDTGTLTFYVLNKNKLDINPEGIYDFYAEGMDYNELRDLIETSKHSGIDLNTERSFLQEVKKNTEALTISIDSTIKINNFPDMSSSPLTNECVKNYLYGFLTQRNSILQKNLVHCQAVYNLRTYEWSIYALCALNGHFWLLDEKVNPKIIAENFGYLNLFGRIDNDNEEPILPLNDWVKMRRVLDEGMKIKALGQFSKENEEILQVLKAEVQNYEIWKIEFFERFQKKYDMIKTKMQSFDNKHEWLEMVNDLQEDFQVMMKKLFEGRIFDKESLEILMSQAVECEETKSFWFNLKTLQGITESVIFSSFWVQDFAKIGFFKELLAVHHRIKLRFQRFEANRTQSRYSRLLKLYKSSGMIVPEVEKLKDIHSRCMETIDEMYIEFQDALRISSSVDIWGKLGNLKERLNQIELKYTPKYQTFRLEIMENQILFLKSFHMQVQNVQDKKKKGNGIFEMEIEDDNKHEHEEMMSIQKKMITVRMPELREIELESQFLSKPSRDFLEDFLKRPEPYLKKCKNLLKIEPVLAIEDSVFVPKRLKLWECKRVTNRQRIKVALEKLLKKKAAHLAEVLENKIFNESMKEDYEKNVGNLLEKIKNTEEVGNGGFRKIIKTFGVGVMKRDEEAIASLRNEFEIYVKNT